MKKVKNLATAFLGSLASSLTCSLPGCSEDGTFGEAWARLRARWALVLALSDVV